MKSWNLLAVGLAVALLARVPAGAQAPGPFPPKLAALPEMPKQRTGTGKHINRVIDMWAKGQPVYYTSPGDAADSSSYDAGKRMAATKADYINYGMESGPLDFKGLADFMRGLVDAGPTRSGHRTPAVIVELPIPGTV